MNHSVFNTKHLAMLVIAFMSGITSGCSFSLGLSFFAMNLLLIYQKQSHRPVWLALTCCFFFFGATRYYQQQAAYFDHKELLETVCNVQAVVQEILPRLDEREQVCIALRIDHIEVGEKKYFVYKNMYLFLPYYTKLWIKPHQKIVINNITLKHPRSSSYESYLIKEGIWAVAHQKKFSYRTIKKPNLMTQYINELCALPLQAPNYTFDRLTHSLYLSIFCGKKIKSPETTHIKKLYSYWGISHHLARSGLHLVILIGLLLFLLSFIPCSASKKQWVIVLLLCFYYATTYPSVAFMRAFYMYLLYTLCRQLYIPSDSIHILFITALITLTANPGHLFFLDFQLSFSITLLILWFCKVTQNTKTIALQ